ncbi:DMT family transporter [Konateibacter massiliensis]|uniref:DMT family transporter n=1 Tax=Konateibacter massiliensis TaxID=2002841 RepID=UPI000C160C1B|nr:DMT family transporter [Konateibacter massiliensis]
MELNKNKIKLLASIGLIAAAVMWGFGFIVVKDSLDFIPPVYMLAFRFTLASAGLGIVFHKRIFKINKKNVKSGLILGILLYISYLLQTIGCQYTTAGKNAFITTIYVVIVPFLYWAMSKKKPDIYCVVSAFMAIAGIGLLSLTSDLTVNIGDVLTFLCGIGFALHLIYISKYSKGQDPIILTLLQIFTAAVLSWITAPFIDGGFPSHIVDTDPVIAILYLGIGATMITFLLQNIGQKYVEPSTAAVLLSMESVFGVIFSVTLLGEVLTTKMLVGCALIFTAVIMAETKFDFAKFAVKKRSEKNA